ncbi:hypothetical protein DsansV1_C31g0218741 [Dioscorea sansibarensis]
MTIFQYKHYLLVRRSPVMKLDMCVQTLLKLFDLKGLLTSNLLCQVPLITFFLVLFFKSNFVSNWKKWKRAAQR